MHGHSDYSPDVYHWIKTDYYGREEVVAKEEAFKVMLIIIDDGVLRSSGKDTFKHIKNICFTESPKEVNAHQSSRYSTFGFSFDKEFIYSNGGRHVIYQTKDEGEAMPTDMHWRHVTYDPADKRKIKDGINFTWEREWRLNQDELSLLLCNSIIVPNEDFKERLIAEIEHMKGFPKYMREKTGIHVDPRPYSQYTPDFIRKFDTMN
ncbi:hypothetical protein [Pectobacterium polaris]|uniref:hypothetical protein n=1 Tax=Pectobacterium polaris TaxID=2042057 RepID=UPI0032EC317F